MPAFEDVLAPFKTLWSAIAGNQNPTPPVFDDTNDWEMRRPMPPQGPASDFDFQKLLRDQDAARAEADEIRARTKSGGVLGLGLF